MTLFNTCHSLGSDPQHCCANKTLKILGDMCFAESLDASYEPKFHWQSHHDLFHSTKFTCHANLQYRSFTSNFRRKFSQLMQIVKTCVAPFTKMHSVGFSEIMPYHVPWVVSYFLEPNVHTCPQNILLYLVTCLAFHCWYPSNCSSCFLDTGVLSHVRDDWTWLPIRDAPRIWYAEAPGNFPRPGKFTPFPMDASISSSLRLMFPWLSKRQQAE